MQKQTKTIKFMLFVLILIPLVLFTIGIVQTFILKSKNNQLNQTNAKLEQSIEKEKDLNTEAEFKSSEEYFKEYQKYFNDKSENNDKIIKNS